MPTVCAIHVSPVKSLRLMSVEAAEISPEGIAGDRELLLVDERGRVATQRQFGVLAQLESRLSGDRDRLELRLPDGSTLEGPLTEEEAAAVVMYGRMVPGHWVNGPFAAAVSELVGRRLRLFRGEGTCAGLDAHPVSLLSRAAVSRLGQHGGHAGDLDARRFRPTLLLDGCEPHVEDGWVGGRVRAGEAVLEVVKLDVRCALTTRNPTTGERDADTLRWIAATRPRPDGEICFGVYAEVAQPGTVRVGDPVVPLTDS
jgi:MOSC domain-containing protein